LRRFVALAVLLFDVNWLRGWLADQGSAAIGRKVALGDMAVGTLTALQDGEEPYPVDLDLSLGNSEIAIAGTLERAALDLSVAIEGPDLAELA
jgi:hypothetical protein